MKSKLSFALPALLLTAGSASAAWNVSAQVRYENDDSFTPWTKADVAFATGAELDRVTHGLKYAGSDGRYAVVPMTSGIFNVIRLSGYVSCAGGFNRACLPGGQGDGFDAQGRHWQVCTNPKCS